MLELHSLANDHPGLSFIVVFFFGIGLWLFCESLGTIGRRTTHVHHHHCKTCRENHEKGPCES